MAWVAGASVWQEAARQSLRALHAHLYSVPLLPVLIGHSVFCTTLAPHAKGHFVLHFWLTFCGGFAGGPLSSLLLMNPAKAPVGLVSSNRTGITWVACWWLMTYSPFAPLLHSIHDTRPVKAMTKACVAYMRATLIVSRVLLTAQLHPGVLIAPVLVATVASCGGKCTYDAINAVYGLATGPSEITVPTYSLRSAFLGSLLFYLSSVLPGTRFLSPDEGAAALVALFLLHSLQHDLGMGLPDWTELLMRLLLWAGNIPWPRGLPQPAKPAAVAVPAHSATSAATPKHDRAPIKTGAQPLANGVHPPRSAASPAPAVKEGSVGDGMAQVTAAAPASADALARPPAQAATAQPAGVSKRKKGGGQGGAADGGWQVVAGKHRKPDSKKAA